LNEGRGRQLAREVERWFILVSILSTSQANFHVQGLAGRLIRPAEARGSKVSLAGLRARMGAERDLTNALFQGELAPGWPINRRNIRDAARIVLPGRMESVPVSALAGSCRVPRPSCG
jgi:hypothetical protein